MNSASLLPVEDVDLQWYAVRVRSHCEEIAASAFGSKGYEHFLPRVRSRRRWSDRVKEVEAPLFPGYVFSRFDPMRRVPILECAGVVGIVSFGKQFLPIPVEEIRSVQVMLQSSLGAAPHPFLNLGQKIRIQSGPLAGVEGVLVEVKNGFRLVASVTILQRSVSVEINREWASPIRGPHARPMPLAFPEHHHAWHRS